MAKNRGNSSSKKKVGNKTRAPRPRKQPTGSTKAKAAKARNPLYVLLIMALLTALALLVNKIYDTQEPLHKKERHGHKEAGEHRDASALKKKSGGKQDAVDKQIKPDSHDAPGKDISIPDPGTEKQSTEEIKLYFIQFNEKTEKTYLSTVMRKVDKRSILENTMRELIRGPSPSEKKKGLLSAVPPDLKLNSVKIKNNTAELDFNGAIERGAGGSILLNRIDQIVFTATQFPAVKNVVIKINGRKQQSLGSDGLSIEGPLHRRQ